MPVTSYLARGFPHIHLRRSHRRARGVRTPSEKTRIIQNQIRRPRSLPYCIRNQLHPTAPIGGDVEWWVVLPRVLDVFVRVRNARNPEFIFLPNTHTHTPVAPIKQMRTMEARTYGRGAGPRSFDPHRTPETTTAAAGPISKACRVSSRASSFPGRSKD